MRPITVPGSRRRTEQLLDGHGPGGGVADLLAAARRRRPLDPGARGDEHEERVLEAFRAATVGSGGPGAVDVPRVPRVPRRPVVRPPVLAGVAAAAAVLVAVATGATGVLAPAGAPSGAASERAVATATPTAPAPPPGTTPVAPPTSRTVAARVLPTPTPPRAPRTTPPVRDGMVPLGNGQEARRRAVVLIRACLIWPQLPARERSRFLRFEPLRTLVRTAGSERRVPQLCSQVLRPLRSGR